MNVDDAFGFLSCWKELVLLSIAQDTVGLCSVVYYSLAF